jgi:type I site-specific restriction endonuclease
VIKIDYPPYQPKIKSTGGKETIFDELRKKWITLTPEEWVRQNFLQYLIQIKKYPATLIAIEKEIQLNDIKKRFDILVYDKNHQPFMIIECKEMNVPLTEATLQQAMRYNIAINVPYLTVTNGRYCLAWKKINNQLQLIEQLPDL